jgi:hypothetical protein
VSLFAFIFKNRRTGNEMPIIAYNYDIAIERLNNEVLRPSEYQLIRKVEL